MRFLIGIFQGGPIVIFQVLATEIVGPKHRVLASVLIFIAQSLSFLLLAIQAWFIPNWKYLQIVTTAPYIFLLIVGYR